ncbi:SOS response-associated peptidase family protein [Lysobacter soyae]|uniref:Abasic site processing protein n=1 Tax=Lysobacter soyae TaxID=2764185 RepID=A0ABX8WSY4_9GAMM|nr:SOS response-associated peptidase family protein [Lysobacter sp. CJ11]QYR53941.1 SOS response-associated peptidase [Lysobacter sp. CJ11]
MCYSAQIEQSYKDYVRKFGADISIDEFAKVFWSDRSAKTPKAMRQAFLNSSEPWANEIIQGIEALNKEQSAKFEQELFAQKTRLNKAVVSLKTKETKKALEDKRIASNKIKAAESRLKDLKRSKLEPKDSRVFPGIFSTVVAAENGKRFVAPMRYGCRLAGKPASYDQRYPGTYNARRDSLEGFWRQQFGYTHALIIADKFYENVEIDCKNVVLEFEPRDGEPMLIACLWSRWTDPKGIEPDLLSFAAITDEPEPEVAAAGHDRTIINIKPEHVDAWLNPDPANLEALYAIFDDKRHPYYEHRIAA